MEYKGYKITAEVEQFDFFTINDDGSPDDWVEHGNGGDVTGYNFEHEDSEKSFFETMSQSDVEELRAVIDARLEEAVKTDVS